MRRGTSRAPAHHHREPPTMNRQVVPSMILSVLIVCCFSVLLHENDDSRVPTNRVRAGIGRSPGPISPSGAAIKSSSLRPARSSEPGGQGRRAAVSGSSRGTKVDPSGEQARSLQAETSDQQSGVLTRAAARHGDPGRSVPATGSLPEEASRRVILPREAEEPH